MKYGGVNGGRILRKSMCLKVALSLYSFAVHVSELKSLRILTFALMVDRSIYPARKVLASSSVLFGHLPIFSVGKVEDHDYFGSRGC